MSAAMLIKRSLHVLEKLSEREYADIVLRVPNSGTEWLDEMIVESRRIDTAEKAMQAHMDFLKDILIKNRDARIAQLAYLTADAMLKAGKL